VFGINFIQKITLTVCIVTCDINYHKTISVQYSIFDYLTMTVHTDNTVALPLQNVYWNAPCGTLLMLLGTAFISSVETNDHSYAHPPLSLFRMSLEMLRNGKFCKSLSNFSWLTSKHKWPQFTVNFVLTSCF